MTVNRGIDPTLRLLALNSEHRAGELSCQNRRVCIAAARRSMRRERQEPRPIVELEIDLDSTDEQVGRAIPFGLVSQHGVDPVQLQLGMSIQEPGHP